MDFSKLSKEAKAKIAEVFESNPSMESCIATVDGQCFRNKNYALSHEKEMMQAAGSEKERAACIGIVECKREDVFPAKTTKASKEPVMVDYTVTEADLNDDAFVKQFPDAKAGDVVKIAGK